MTLEGLVALGYTATGAIVVKLIDIGIKWRATTRVSPNAELTATLEFGAKLREEYRKQAEELREERDKLLAQVEEQEGELAALRIRVDALKKECDELKAELLLIRRGRRR